MAELRAEIRGRLKPSVSAMLEDGDVDRFTRARNGKVDKVVDMIEKWSEWWVTKLPDGKTPADYSQYCKDENEAVYTEYMPHSNLGYDKQGHPAYWEKTGDISGRMAKIRKHLSEDQLVIRHVRQQEMAVHRCRLSSQRRGHVVEKQIIVMDMANLSYTLDTVALSTFRRALAIDEAFYPERLKTLIMINVPWYFTAMWAVIRPWVDPTTAEKFQLVRHDYKEKLREYFDDDNIPIEYGGTMANFGWTSPDNILSQDMDVRTDGAGNEEGKSALNDTCGASEDTATTMPTSSLSSVAAATISEESHLS